MHNCVPRASSAHRDQRSTSDPLGLEFQRVMSFHVGAGIESVSSGPDWTTVSQSKANRIKTKQNKATTIKWNRNLRAMLTHSNPYCLLSEESVSLQLKYSKC